MLKISLIIFIILINSISSCQTPSTEIKNCFENFKTDIINLDGNAAISFVDEKTIEFYSQLLEKVKKYDSLQLMKEYFIVRLTILKIRHLIPNPDILAMNGKELLIASINKGITNNGNIKRTSMGAITIKDSLATAERLLDGRLTPMLLKFKKENNIWKYQMLSSWSPIDFRQLEPDPTITEEDYIFHLLENLSGRKPSPEIWKPIQ